MAEDNNALGQFGMRSAKFDELLKKYQTIDEGDTVAAPPIRTVEPAAKKSVAEPAPEETAEEPVLEETAEEPAPEETVEPTTEEPQPEVISEPQPLAEPQPDAQGFSFDESVEMHEIVPEIQPELAEEAVSESIPEPEIIPEPEEEPDYSYDIDMFSTEGERFSLDIDSFDNSWIDSALDDSLFYKPEPIEEPADEAASEQAEEPEPEQTVEDEETDTVSDQLQSVPVTEYEQECYITDPIQYNPKAFVEPEQKELSKDIAAGGYIASSDLADFEFSPESGMDFETADMHEEAAEKSAKQKKKSAREKKNSGKNEMSSVTLFSKNYKASEGKGSKKDGFLVRNFIPKGTDTALEKIRKIIMIICVLTFAFAAVYLFNDFVIQPFMTVKRLETLEGMVGKGDDVADIEELAEEYPGVEFPDGMLEKYAELYAENPDLVGWIKIEEIGLSLPVVQGDDNSEYLKRNFDGNYSKYGSIFMNCANDSENLNYNTVLFGHHMTDKTMFGNLELYKDVSYYKKAPVIEFNTIYGDYKWKIFAVFVTNGTAEGDDGYIFDYTFTDLSSPEAVEKFLGEIDQRAIYKPEVDISVSDKILTLSTCSYEFDEARLVVMARMVREGESEEVSGKVITNDNPRYPAAYYEEKGLTNPYESAYKWQPT